MQRGHPQKSSNIVGEDFRRAVIYVVHYLLRTTAGPPKVGDRVEAGQGRRPVPKQQIPGRR